MKFGQVVHTTIVVIQRKLKPYQCELSRNDVIPHYISVLHSLLFLHTGASYKPEFWWERSTVIALTSTEADF